MFTYEYEAKTLSAFGVTRNIRTAQYIKDNNENIVDEFHVEWYWAATIDYLKTKQENSMFLIAIMQTTKWCRAFMDIPSLSETIARLKPVDLIHWDKPFVSALESICLMPEVPNVKEDSKYACEVKFSFPAGFGSFSFCGPVEYRHYSQLWNVLFDTVKKVSAIYDDDTLNAYIQSNYQRE